MIHRLRLAELYCHSYTITVAPNVRGVWQICYAVTVAPTLTMEARRDRGSGYSNGKGLLWRMRRGERSTANEDAEVYCSHMTLQ